ncbi:hypothetical protein AO1008_06478 [Aspergillus oryzae 100-8]|uniref:Atos-like conserved domain-containing protein n=1 Tax=Aspergillus oryzae (strain 3.042) TaxID=1160506 RepID=I8A397_ASPO3|nr:hypothetical protein Ao3042_04789 [Aspergillus oryzae 3.042]KDE79979.1 hypothetical protein AO1008_06478 [Aspergillus oryzae 100-8]|eukprot:EIT78889.1 hypothetical protein Ao3042_04789 [Aspergillus oryzae 3.042]
MPIFQDPDRQRFYDLWSDDHPPIREDERQLGGSSWAHHHRELESAGRRTNFPGETFLSDCSPSDLRTCDREELIHYIKNADTSAWAHRLYGDSNAGHSISRTPDKTFDMKADFNARGIPSTSPGTNGQELGSPADIQRPRSALHSGDFREGTRQDPQPLPQSPLPGLDAGSRFPLLGSSPTAPWFTAPVFASPTRTQPVTANVSNENARPPSRTRAPSVGSFSSSYVLKAPTSPLVYQANNTDLDFSARTDSTEQLGPLEKASRRRTLPPETFRHLQSSPTTHRGAFNFQSSHSSGKWDEPLPFHHCNPRRSLNSAYTLQLASSVQSPSLRTRRPSLVSEKSSRPHAPLVGSYEESILRGRMSMNPSKPLDFTAQIGVLGKGKCKANLKCPPHVTIPFPAVFYSYPTSGSGRSISDDNPSPYVGLIDLENSLPKDTAVTSRRRRHHHSPAEVCGEMTDNPPPPKANDQDALRRREKRHRRAESPKCPPGGCYRIPQQGQLQVMIKNPNKTAVKLFLIPYDLSDMEPGTKTFIRQRSYSAGPVIDMPLTARKNYGTDRPEASLSSSEDPNDKPILRYLIHLNICCPSKGRFYLHSSIRIVFANRVPDGKERLRNEIQHPEPRYAPYKPARDVNQTQMNTKLVTDRGCRRPAADQGSIPASLPDLPSPCGREGQPATPMPVIEAQAVSSNMKDARSGQRAPHPFRPIPSLREEVLPLHDHDAAETYQTGSGSYSKLTKGDHGYGGYPFSPLGGSEAGESLLAKRLRGLDVQKHNSSGMD